MNEILDTSISDSSDDCNTDARKTPTRSGQSKASTPSATVSRPTEQSDGFSDEGQIEFVDDFNEDFVDVSNDDDAQSDYSEKSDSNLPDASDVIATKISDFTAPDEDDEEPTTQKYDSDANAEADEEKETVLS